MDLFDPGQLDPAGNPIQVHDYNPGIPPSGLFWTQPVQEESAEAELEEGTASFKVEDLDERDFHDLRNSLMTDRSVPATVSFDMQWTAAGPAVQVADPVQRFRGSFLFGTVAITWSARQDGFEFVSDPGSVTTVAAVLGRERNGVFF